MEYKGIALEGLQRLYAAAVVEVENEKAEMSLEWCDSYGDKVKILSYNLIFDFTQPNQEERVKKVLSFATKEALLEEMQEVAQFFEAH